MSTLFEIKTGEVNIYTGQDADDKIQELRTYVAGLEAPENGDNGGNGDNGQADVDLSGYTFYEKGKPAGLVVRRGQRLEAMTFPAPTDYGISAPKRYSQTIVYRDALAKFLQLRTKGKGTWIQQAKQLMVIILPIVIITFLIFIMAVILGD